MAGLVILIAAWYNENFVRLPPFIKKTQKRPQRVIEKAKRALADLKERGIL